MAYCINTYNLPSIRSYDDALRVWEKIKPLRGQDADVDARPLNPNRQIKYETIRKDDGGSIYLRYHRTDVVVYIPDGSIIVEPYASTSTSLFAHNFTPFSVCPRFTSPLGCLLALSPDRVIRIDDEIRLVLTEPRNQVYSPALGETHEPVEVWSLDKSKTREALKRHWFHEFCAWMQAYRSMAARIEFHDLRDAEHTTVLAALDGGPEHWPTLIGAYRGRNVLSVAESIRAIIYKAEKCVDIEEKPYLTLAEVRQQENVRRRYQYFVS